MTAEIAIINKSAVALATDSAVTISTGSRHEKIFDTADKLFELCNHNPIGIMIYNGMSFAETPLPSLIKVFRRDCASFASVADASTAFLSFLNDYGNAAPQEVKNRNIIQLIRNPLAQVNSEANKKFGEGMSDFIKNNPKTTPKLLTQYRNDTLSQVVEDYSTVIKEQDDAMFFGGTFEGAGEVEKTVKTFVDKQFNHAPQKIRDSVYEVAFMLLQKNHMSDSVTGLVIAGFGHGDIFPTLLSYEIDGTVGAHLKYIATHSVAIDISEDGGKATVIPFAQKEMVERFLYGLDEKIETDISKFCKSTVSEIADKLFDLVEFAKEDDEKELRRVVSEAENAFAEGLKTKAFEAIRVKSRAQIDDIVEFMPKPELAEMAEALVNLTSIKRRVSRGMETVAGPIDVAVISHSEGFVWIKRKHYFDIALNSRYLERLRGAYKARDDGHAEDEEP